MDTKKQDELIKLAKKMYESRNDILNPDNLDALMENAKSVDEKIFYSGMYNVVLKIKQNEVIKSGRF